MSTQPSPYFFRRGESRPDEVITLNSYSVTDEPLFSLAEYFRVLQQYRWLILGVAAAVLTAALIFAFTRTPMYTAEAILLIERQAPRVLKAQYELLRSRDLASMALCDSGVDTAALAREAHISKSSSANVDAITLSIMVKRREFDARWRNRDMVAAKFKLNGNVEFFLPHMLKGGKA